MDDTIGNTNILVDNSTINNINNNPTKEQLQTTCEWSLCSAVFENKYELLPHLTKSHMVANHLKPVKFQTETGEELIDIPCKWNTCNNNNYKSIDDLVIHVSNSHLQLTKEEMEYPNYCFWINCGGFR